MSKNKIIASDTKLHAISAAMTDVLRAVDALCAILAVPIPAKAAPVQPPVVINTPKAAPLPPSRKAPAKATPRLALVVPETPAPTKRTRKQGNAAAIVAAMSRPNGALANELRTMARYATSAVYLDRLAKAHGFTWYETGTTGSDKWRFHAARVTAKGKGRKSA